MLGESGGLKARYEVSGPFTRDKWAKLNFQYQNPTNASQQVVRGLFGGLGLPRTRTADFLEFAFADFDTAEVVFESIR